jgi:hypothetical protein
MLFLTAGIVFLTLVVNGTTTKALLSALRLTEISIGRKEDMKNAVKRIMRLKRQAIRMYLLSPRMTDTSFELVDTYCTVKDPYAKKHKVRRRFFRQGNLLESKLSIIIYF